MTRMSRVFDYKHVPSGTLSRRKLIQLGAAGSFGLTLPKLLQAENAASVRPHAKSCILIVLSGGLSHIDTWDPKPRAASELRGPYSPIATTTLGVQLTERFPELAKRMHRFCLVRSMSHTDTVHVTAAHTMLTGQADGTRNNDSPMIGSLISKFQPTTANMPSHVWLHNMKTGTNKVPRYNSGLAKIGYAHAPVRIGYELDNPASDGFRVRDFDPPAGVSQDRVRQQLSLLNSLKSSRALAASAASVSYETFYDRARELVTGPTARRAFDLTEEPDALRDRYGRNPLGQYALMARRLVEADVRLVSVTGWPGLAPGETEPTVTQVWDTHDSYYSDGETMFGSGPYGMKWAFPRLDQALSALLDDMHDRGLLEETLVAVVGEFGRTPKFEGKGRGRGHWPHAYTGLLAGGGISGGSVYGASDKEGGYVAEGRLVSHLDFGATLFHALGIPPETRYGPDGFSYRVSEGEPLMELFS
jgi:hypothetical protein